MTFQTQIFVPTLAVGVPFVCGAWFLTRQRAHDSWLWRFGLSFLAAVVVTPTACSISGAPGIFPAYFIASFALPGNAGAVEHGLLHGVLPLVCGIALIFALSTASRRFLKRLHDAG